LASGKLLGHIGDKEVLLVQVAGDILAIDAHCSHYSGPLADGLVVGNTIRCPWHHACFDLKTGEAVRAPALSQRTGWKVEHDGDNVYVREPREAAAQGRQVSAPGAAPEKIVIVGGGAA